MNTPLQSSQEPPISLNQTGLRIPYELRASFFTTKNVAASLADATGNDVAVCRALPDAAQNYQNLFLEQALTQGRDIILIVKPDSNPMHTFFDRALTMTSSDRQFIESISSRLFSENVADQMMSLTDLANFLSHVSLGSTKDSDLRKLLDKAADLSLTSDDPGLAAHASTVFGRCPEALLPYRKEARTFLEVHGAESRNWQVCVALGFALDVLAKLEAPSSSQ